MDIHKTPSLSLSLSLSLSSSLSSSLPSSLDMYVSINCYIKNLLPNDEKTLYFRSHIISFLVNLLIAFPSITNNKHYTLYSINISNQHTTCLCSRIRILFLSVCISLSLSLSVSLSLFVSLYIYIYIYIYIIMSLGHVHKCR